MVVAFFLLVGVSVQILAPLGAMVGIVQWRWLVLDCAVAVAATAEGLLISGELRRVIRGRRRGVSVNARGIDGTACAELGWTAVPPIVLGTLLVFSLSTKLT